VATLPAQPAEKPYDLVLRNARIVDGTGSPWYRADLAVRGDTIARIAPAITEPAARVIDVGGGVVAPGFVDLHTHAIRGIFQVPTADNYVRQGVTTILEGPDGASPVPLKPFLDKLEALPRSLNIGSFIGQGSVRQAVMGLANRTASAEELERMRGLVRQGMADGAFGLSTGLFYVPGAFTPLAEVVELQKIVAPYRGVHTSHMRDEAGRVVESVKETIAIGEQGGVPTQISHHKTIGKANWGRSADTLKLVDEARARGVDTTIDQYPYTASSTSIQGALVPQWAQEGGRKAVLQRLRDPETRAKIRSITADLIRNERGAGDPRNVVLTRCEWDMALAGKNLSQLTQARGEEPTIENAAETVLWIVEQGGCSGVFHAMSEDDLRRIRYISHHVTAVILRKQAEKQVQLQLQRMSALSEIDRVISSSLDMRLSLDVVLNEVRSQLGVDAASILLLNPSSQTLEYFAGKGFRTLGVRQSRLLLGEGLAGQVGLERKVIHLPILNEAEGRQTRRYELLKDEEFVEYFGVPLIAKGLLKGVLEVFHRIPLDPDPEWMNYLETLGGQAAIAIDNAQLFEGMQRSNLELVTAYDATIEGWSRAMDLRDKETEGHTRRVTELAVQLAKKMGVNQQDIVQIRRGALLHDIGKLGVPDHILHKPDKLDRIEWAVMRQHPTYAFNMLLSVNYLRPALDIPYCHHEKWDGSGYPRGLKGVEIPLAARIFAIVDVWDALRSDRPYRAGWPDERIREHIIEESGSHFDPHVVEGFMALLDELADPQ
jgi:dihydroorotase/N-acyl-D-amino-acid deacylase